MRTKMALFALFIAPLFAEAQMGNLLVSPEVHPDRTATFRIEAPNADAVKLDGDWLVAKEIMTKGSDGVWSITLGPLNPGRAVYTFDVDGMQIADPVNPLISPRARAAVSIVDIPGYPPELWEARDVPHGKVEIVWAKSKVTGDTRAYRVYTPPEYDKKGFMSSYPVLYLLHGNNGTESDWTDIGRVNFILDSMIADESIDPMIVVMPSGYATPEGFSTQNNTAILERYLLDELIPQVEERYRVKDGKDDRAIAGVSMGGGQAIEIGLRNLEMFTYIASFSGEMPDNFQTKFSSLMNDPRKTNRQIEMLWIGCGRQDPLFDENQKLAEMLRLYLVDNTFYQTEGLHNFDLWRKYFVTVLPQLFD